MTDSEQPTLPAAEHLGAPGAGARIGRFVTIRSLGAGGMGVVLEAHDPELDRRVAIKLLHASTDEPTGAARLQREAQAMAKLSHPNVVAVYEVGRLGEQTFLAMELVEGDTLRAWLRPHRAWREVVAILVSVGRGLVAAHEAGLVHRDVKPENILVGRDGRARITDFGLVSGTHRSIPTPGNAPIGVSLTVDGTVVGTPAYMSPEHWAGTEIDARSDQFSFCVTAWEALFGRRPFAPSGSVSEVRAAVAQARIDVPRVHGVPRAIESVLRRGLAIDPGARWPSIAELLAALERASRSRRGAIAGATVGAIAIGAIATIAATRESTPPPRPPSFEVRGETIHRLTFGDSCEELPSLSSDGATVYYDAAIGTGYRLFSLGTNRTTELTHGPASDIAATPSPDGSRLAFLRSGTERMGLYVGDLDALDRAHLVALGSMRPVWSPDGRFVWTGNAKAITRRDATGILAPSRTLEVPAGKIPFAGIELPDGRLVMLAHPVDGSATADSVFVYSPDGTTGVQLYAATLDEVLAMLPGGEAVAVAVVRGNHAIELWRVPLVVGEPATQLTNGSIAAHSRLAIAGSRLVWSDCIQTTSLAAFRDRFVDLTAGSWNDWNPRAIDGDRMLFLSDRGSKFEIFRGKPGDRSEPEKVPLGTIEPVGFATTRDGKLLALAEGSGLYVSDGAAPPRLLITEAGDLSPTIDRHGTRIYFERHDGEVLRIASIASAGGEPAWVVPGPGFGPAASPIADVLAYFHPTSAGGEPMLFDLRTKIARPLRPAAPITSWKELRWSTDGARVLLVGSDHDLVEIDVATGADVRTLPIGAAQTMGATYAGSEVIIGRTSWHGNVWTAELKSP